jgi:hypothetical protein
MDDEVVNVQQRPRFERGKAAEADRGPDWLSVAIRQQNQRRRVAAQPRQQSLADVRIEGTALSHRVSRVVVKQGDNVLAVLRIVQIGDDDLRVHKQGQI